MFRFCFRNVVARQWYHCGPSLNRLVTVAAGAAGAGAGAAGAGAGAAGAAILVVASHGFRSCCGCC